MKIGPIFNTRGLTSGSHLGQKKLFIQKLSGIWWLEKCEFCWKKGSINVNFGKHEIFKMWILWKLRFQNVNFVKIEISEMWILPKIDIFKTWILWKLRFQNVNFVKIEISKIWIWSKFRFFGQNLGFFMLRVKLFFLNRQ